MSLLRQGKALALTLYLGESDQWQGTPLYVALIQYLRSQGCAGATVTRAIAGYGAGSRLHENSGLRWSSDAPVVIQVIDQQERLRRLLPALQEMLGGGLIILHEVEVLKYTHARTRGLSNKLPVRQVMATAITTVQLETSVATVLDLLLDAPFRALPVVDSQGHLQGIISTGDLIQAGMLPMRRGMVRTALELDDSTAKAVETPLEQARQSERTAQDVMNHQVRTVELNQSIREAAEIMLETGLRRLPVVDTNNVVVGMLSRADLLQVVVTSPLTSPQASSATQPLRHTQTLTGVPPQQQPVADYVTSDVAAVDAQTPLAEVIDALTLSPVKRVIVVDQEHKVVGIISDVDVLARMQEEGRPGFLTALTSWARGKPARVPTATLRTGSGKPRSAADMMNRDVVTVAATTTIQETIERMIATKRKVLPVVDEQGRLIGVVGRSDLLRILIEG
jgi:CBS-domain-containing membrane protein